MKLKLGEKIIFLFSISLFISHQKYLNRELKGGEAQISSEKIGVSYLQPPLVTHEFDLMAVTDCLSCHQKSGKLNGKMAPQIPHKILNNCLQCHVSSSSYVKVQLGSENSFKGKKNIFVGMKEPGKGERSTPIAPPSIPHSTQLRGNCLACHGSGGPISTKIDHGSRQNCRQCHVEFPLKLYSP